MIQILIATERPEMDAVTQTTIQKFMKSFKFDVQTGILRIASFSDPNNSDVENNNFGRMVHYLLTNLVGIECEVTIRLLTETYGGKEQEEETLAPKEFCSVSFSKVKEGKLIESKNFLILSLKLMELITDFTGDTLGRILNKIIQNKEATMEDFSKLKSLIHFVFDMNYSSHRPSQRITYQPCEDLIKAIYYRIMKENKRLAKEEQITKDEFLIWLTEYVRPKQFEKGETEMAVISPLDFKKDKVKTSDPDNGKFGMVKTSIVGLGGALVGGTAVAFGSGISQQEKETTKTEEDDD